MRDAIISRDEQRSEKESWFIYKAQIQFEGEVGSGGVGGWMSTGVEEGWCSISKETAAARWTAGWATQGVGRGESGFVLNGLKRVFIEITTKSWGFIWEVEGDRREARRGLKSILLMST